MNRKPNHFLSPKFLSTPAIRKKIVEYVGLLKQLYDVSPPEEKRFGNFRIRRSLRNESEHKNPAQPMYDCVGNEFYFPPRTNNFSGYRSLSDFLIMHEASHYVHYSINDKLVETINEHRYSGWPHGLESMIELIANYPIIGLGIVPDRTYDYENSRTHLQVFHKYGLKFLPELARLNLDEFVNRGILK